MVRKISPAKPGKNLLDEWLESTTPKNPFGSMEKLEKLLVHKDSGNFTWNKIGCSGERDRISTAIKHYKLNTVPV